MKCHKAGALLRCVQKHSQCCMAISFEIFYFINMHGLSNEIELNMLTERADGKK